MKFDTNKLKDTADIVEVIAKRIDLRKNGSEYSACCPFHEEKTPSFSVTPAKQFYYCFGCGASGDVIDFIIDYERVDFKEACEILGGQRSTDGSKPELKVIKTTSYYDGIEPIIPCPELPAKIRAYNPKRADDPEKQYVNYSPSMVFPYYDADGQPIGYIIRQETGDKKITPSLMYCRLQDGTETWCHFPFPKLRPLYNAPNISNKPLLYLAEGEKCVNAASIMSSYTAITASGGTFGPKHTDFSAVEGHDILIWPDNDVPGQRGVWKYVIPAMIENGAASIKMVWHDPSKPKGWDIADAVDDGMNEQDIIAWAKPRVFVVDMNGYDAIQHATEDDYQIPVEDDPEDYDSWESADTSEKTTEKPPEKPENGSYDRPYRILGYNGGKRFYLPDSTKQVSALTADGHTNKNLMVLADLQHWEANFPTGRPSAPVDWAMAVNSLLQLSSRRLFDIHEHLRGRGAWMDDNRSILHLGEIAYVDGVKTLPHEIKSKYIYEKKFDFEMNIAAPANNSDANKMFKICEKLSWENKLSAHLLAGWCVIAPVCGILTWRPHIWITGPSGSGKTVVVEDIITVMLGKIGIIMQGKSTEPGIRQELCQDARPVVIDEAEGEDEPSAKRMQQILDLARVASSGGRIVKGTQDGSGTSFSVRSCFCFSSINPVVKHFADESRISKLVLRKDNSDNAADKYVKLADEIEATFTEEYAAAMLARSVANLPTLQKNTKTFIKASAKYFNNRRIADQLGVMLAGAFLCFTDKEVTPEQAYDWVSAREWEDHTVIGSSSDAERLLSKIATHRIRLTADNRTVERSLGELIIDASNSSDAAREEIKRWGIVGDVGGVIIANNSDPIKKLLDGTPWSAGWSRTLKEIAGAEPVKHRYFSPGIKCRGIRLPIGVFEDDKKDVDSDT